MRVDLSGGACVEVLEKVGQAVGRGWSRVDFGGEGFEKSASMLDMGDVVGASIPPLCQASDLDRKLFETVGHVEFGVRLFAVTLLRGKNISVCMTIFLLGRGSDVERVGDGGHGRSLQCARSAA